LLFYFTDSSYLSSKKCIVILNENIAAIYAIKNNTTDIEAIYEIY